MHKSYFIIIFAFFLFIDSKSNAQDLVVTSTNDSINCIVLSQIDVCEITYLKKDKRVNETYNLSQIKIIKIGFYNNANIVRQDSYSSIFFNKKRLDSLRYSGKNFRFSINGLYAFRYSANNSNNNSILNDLASQLRHNFGFFADVHCAINKSKNLLLGIQFSRVQGNADANNIVLEKKISNQPSLFYEGNAALQVTLTTYGINFLKQLSVRNPNKLIYLTAVLSYVTYYEDFRISDTYNLITRSKTFATTLGIIYERRLDRHLSAGFGATIDGGVITNLVIDENDKPMPTLNLNSDNGIGLGRITFSTGLRYYL